ncbi:hypothetical protein [Actinoplanes campanulatus]|uniref:hypothetical protein n=1 Tax=Actinoplanes campanulatus TaxID=113559 RepID=UPI00195357F3|nr:hypothetical protein [Actinoplanes capillaceus]
MVARRRRVSPANLRISVGLAKLGDTTASIDNDIFDSLASRVRIAAIAINAMTVVERVITDTAEGGIDLDGP